MIEYLEIPRHHPRPDLVREVVRVLVRGGLVAVPTDTTFGVFAAIEHREAVERLSQLRELMAGDDVSASALRDKPMAMVFADIGMLGEYVVLSSQAFKLVKRLLPGPYTLILPASRAVPKLFQSKRREVGARIPDEPLVQAILAAHGAPVLSTTLKSADGTLLGDPVAISEQWPHHIDLVLEAGTFVPEQSTVLAVDGDEVTLIREGKGSIGLI